MQGMLLEALLLFLNHFFQKDSLPKGRVMEISPSDVNNRDLVISVRHG